MNTETFAGRTLNIFILFLPGLAFGLFLTVTGHGVASDAEGQLGGGIAFFIGWGITYLGYFVMIVSVLAAGISWVVVAVKFLVDPQPKKAMTAIQCMLKIQNPADQNRPSIQIKSQKIELVWSWSHWRY